MLPAAVWGGQTVGGRDGSREVSEGATVIVQDNGDSSFQS